MTDVIDLCSSEEDIVEIEHVGHASQHARRSGPELKRQRLSVAEAIQGNSHTLKPTPERVAQPWGYNSTPSAAGSMMDAQNPAQRRENDSPAQPSGRAQVSQSMGSAQEEVRCGGPQAPASHAPAESSSLPLSTEQKRVLQLVKAGKNVFFTGNAGTGKSFLLNHIIQNLKDWYKSDFRESVAVCASTGIAATHIGGTTLHSAYGVGVPKTSEDFARAWKDVNRKKIRGWKVLLVDEISMISGEMFEHLEKVTRQIRGHDNPFGGLQLVLCGDFFQLPPIQTKWHPSMKSDAFLNRGHTFQAPAWSQCRLQEQILSQVFRQKDARFVRILDSIRYNEGVAAALSELMRCCHRPLHARDGVEPTRLFARNADVSDVNEQRLANLPDEMVTLKGVDEVHPYEGSSGDAEYKRQQLQTAEFFKDCLAPRSLNLKACVQIGAQVMLLRNLDLEGESMLVNGSRGVVIGFAPIEEAMALNSPDPIGWHERWRGIRLPKVRFLNGREEVLPPTKFAAEVPATGSVSREQVPLKLAWAITIHKCQGMTLDFVIVSLNNIFAEGQAYVALSRACSLDGLEIADFSPNCVRTSALAIKFHKCLVQGQLFEDDGWQRLMQITNNPAAPTSQGSQGERGAYSQGGGHPQSSGGRLGAAQASGNTNVCFKCGQPGHWARACPNR